MSDTTRDSMQPPGPSRVCESQSGSGPSTTDSQFPRTQTTLMNELGTSSQPRCDGAWRTFFEIYGPIAYRFARHRGLRHSDADEVVANVMGNLLRWFRHGGRHDRTIGRFRHYFRTVVNNAITAQCKPRTSWIDVATVPEPTAPDPDEDRWREIERQERLHVCLERVRSSGRIRPRDWEIFELVVMQHQPPADVARRFGVSTSRVYVIKHEISRWLREVWDELNGILGEV